MGISSCASCISNKTKGVERKKLDSAIKYNRQFIIFFFFINIKVWWGKGKAKSLWFEGVSSFYLDMRRFIVPTSQNNEKKESVIIMHHIFGGKENNATEGWCSRSDKLIEIK